MNKDYRFQLIQYIILTIVLWGTRKQPYVYNFICQKLKDSTHISRYLIISVVFPPLFEQLSCQMCFGNINRFQQHQHRSMGIKSGESVCLGIRIFKNAVDSGV